MAEVTVGVTHEDSIKRILGGLCMFLTVPFERFVTLMHDVKQTGL